MKKILNFVFVILLIGIHGVNAKEYPSRVVDGDTLEISTVNNYRLAGIDAPEHDQVFGKESSERMAELIENGKLTGLWCLPKADKYGRDVCIVTLKDKDGNKYDPAEVLIKEGLAEVEYARFLPPSTEKIYKHAETEAKQQKLGIWSLGDSYVKPWKWRKSHK